MNANNLADDYFSGAGGFDIWLHERGYDVNGFEVMPEARETRRLNGLRTNEDGDVRNHTTKPGAARLHAAGPPCPAFSIQGKGAGRKVFPLLHDAARSIGRGVLPDFAQLDEIAGDGRVSLVLQPLRLALEGMPDYLLWEQVPTAAPLWHEFGDVLADHGYDVAVGVLNAADYGAPQHRKRAVLLARRDSIEARLPEPTVTGGDYVTMADALGWGMTKRPSYTVTGGGAYTGGAEHFGTQARKGMKRQFDAGDWIGPERYRITPEEAAILQGFPPGMKFAGTKGMQAMQIGNAVPGHLARALVNLFPRP
jgi:DNA (cytosine-5)-methyltransferase 1